MSSKIETVKKTFQKRKAQEQVGYSQILTTYIEELILIFLKLFQKIEEWILCISVYETSTIMI